MKDEKVKEILYGLESGYDQMADKFSGTRKYFWRDLEFISDHLNAGDRVLDYGCGNGRMIELIKDKKIEYVGVDISGQLISAAGSKYPDHNFQKIGSQDSLPFPDNYFNRVISIAVFHHFPVSHAQKMAQELYRVTKPDGEIVITVWNLWQKRFRKYLFSGSVILRKIFRLVPYRSLGLLDIYIPFKNNEHEEYFNRYHHAYTKSGLKKIFSTAGFKCERLDVVSGKNIIYVGRKNQ